MPRVVDMGLAVQGVKSRFNRVESKFQAETDKHKSPNVHTQVLLALLSNQMKMNQGGRSGRTCGSLTKTCYEYESWSGPSSHVVISC